MFWSKQRRAQQLRAKQHGRRWRRRALRLEHLESRTVLAAGVVDVQLAPFAPPGSTLNLLGDGSNNEVDIRQTLNVGEYFIEGKNGTLLKLNGAFATTPSMTVNGINGDITVNLEDGNDIFRFEARSDALQSNVPEDLVINNGDGSDINIIDTVLINGDLQITKNSGSSGYSELQVLNSTVIGYTNVDNTGGGAGGDTLTKIDNSRLQGNGGPDPAFTLLNGDGFDSNNIRGNSQIGLGPFPQTGAVVDIENGAGGSETIFTGASAVAGFGTTTVYGEVNIDNGLNVPGFLDLVSFNGTNVLGPVNIANADGNTSTLVVNSTLGSHLALGSDNQPTLGGPLVVQNNSGFDSFSMTTSTAPWGVLIDNDAGTGESTSSNWGSETRVEQSFVGTSPYGPRLPETPGPSAGVAMLVLGDNGRDLVNVTQTTIGGRLDLQLLAGNNELNLTNNATMAGLSFVTNGGNDRVVIDRAKILVDIFVRLGDGADEFYVTNVNFTSGLEWPSTLLGVVDIQGEDGVDRTNLSSLIPLAFELLATP